MLALILVLTNIQIAQKYIFVSASFSKFSLRVLPQSHINHMCNNHGEWGAISPKQAFTVLTQMKNSPQTLSL